MLYFEDTDAIRRRRTMKRCVLAAALLTVLLPIFALYPIWSVVAMKALFALSCAILASIYHTDVQIARRAKNAKMLARATANRRKALVCFMLVLCAGAVLTTIVHQPHLAGPVAPWLISFMGPFAIIVAMCVLFVIGAGFYDAITSIFNLRDQKRAESE